VDPASQRREVRDALGSMAARWGQVVSARLGARDMGRARVLGYVGRNGVVRPRWSFYSFPFFFFSPFLIYIFPIHLSSNFKLKIFGNFFSDLKYTFEHTNLAFIIFYFVYIFLFFVILFLPSIFLWSFVFQNRI
jgi:hypothetical protein